MFTFKFRRDMAWDWTSKNPILAEGEPGVETDTGRLKIGDGLQNWADLDYFIPLNEEEASNVGLPAHVDSDTPHPVYDDGPSLFLLYENAKV